MASTDAMHNTEELAGYEGAKMGMWLFLATELLLFSVMFAGFSIFHSLYPAEFKLAHNSLDWKMGLINTIFLITSSGTVALALDSVQRGNNKKANGLLFATLILAAGFLVVKYIEYTGKFGHGIFPGNVAKIVDPSSAVHAYIPVAASMQTGVNLFFSFYFIMTGVHGIHVLIGMTVLLIILIKNTKNRYSARYYTPLENGALYWHLIDLIWIYLFPLFYLIR